jgi:hypothetical protein
MTEILKIVFLWAGLVTLQQVADSGRCVTLAETPDARVERKPMIAPGPPPLLSFRYYEGKAHQRFGNADLMLDDAGH